MGDHTDPLSSDMKDQMDSMQIEHNKGQQGQNEAARTRYVIGFDMGENSVGAAAIEYDDDGYAIKPLAIASFIHDGGADPNSGQSKYSRLASAGVARRTRRLFKRRRARLEKLEAMLDSDGFGIDPAFPRGTYDEWLARDRLSREFVEQSLEREHLVALAVLHIARHRGWRNPWHSFEVLAGLETPSTNLQRTLDRTSELVGGTEIFETLGQAVSAVVTRFGNTRTIRPRQNAEQVRKPNHKDSVNADGPLMQEQVRQEDQLAELRLILRTQRVPSDVADRICREVFHAAKPHVPSERVGHDVIPGMQQYLRASRCALEFQEFRIRAFVGNLRLGPSKTRLSTEQYESLVGFLLSWRDPSAPRMADVAAALDVKPRALNRDALDEESVAVPFDRTSFAVEDYLKKSDPIRKWWNDADPDDRADFVALISDVTGESGIESLAMSGIGELIASDDHVSETLEKIAQRFQSGRTAYSRESLRMMLAVMREHRCDEFTARKIAFGLEDDWRPPLPTLDDEIEHPALQRINTIVRRFILGCVEQWGTPERIVIEHVRSAFLGPTGQQEYRQEVNRNQRRTEAIRAELQAQGIQRPSRTDIRRSLALQRQNCNCLYCGTKIDMASSEMDHIVPDSLGGSNRRENLVAVCRDCNASKGSQSFVEFASSGRRPNVSLDAARRRVDEWQPINENRRQLMRLKSMVKHRLGLTQADLGEVDERSLATTAYAARELRRRIAGSLGISEAGVDVYQGRVTAEARYAGQVNDTIQLRNKAFKTRFDRRHHAVDAAVITTITPTIARVLAERSELKAAAQYEGRHDDDWKSFTGQSENAQTQFTLWRTRVASVADLLAREIAADHIPVVRQLRLNSRVGAVHADTVRRLASKAVTDGWTADEVDRIVDPVLYEQMLSELRTRNAKSGLIKYAASIPPDSERYSNLRGENASLTHPQIATYPTGGAQIVVRDGAVAIGTSVHHARIYAWQTKGGFGFGWIRVFAGELAALGLAGGDILTCELPVASASMRNANRGLREKIENGLAKPIGWVTQDDELEIDPNGALSGGGSISRFLQSLPERHWLITGLATDSKVSIAPAYLAAEGLDTSDSHVVADISQIIANNRVMLSLNSVLSDPQLLVVRRTALGKPRWRSRSLPASWSPWKAAEAAFRP